VATEQANLDGPRGGKKIAESRWHLRNRSGQQHKYIFFLNIHIFHIYSKIIDIKFVTELISIFFHHFFILIFSYNSFFGIYIYSFYRFSSLFSYSYVFLIKIKCIYTIFKFIFVSKFIFIFRFSLIFCF